MMSPDPAKGLRISTPGSESCWQATNSLATRFMPSRSGVIRPADKDTGYKMKNALILEAFLQELFQQFASLKKKQFITKKGQKRDGNEDVKEELRKK